jgi:hypothetical protein
MRRSGCLYRLGARTLATLVAVFAALFAAEFWIGGPQHLEGPAQLRWLFEADPETGFRTAANHDGSMLEGGRRVRVRFNELGMRGPACGSKQAGETRVLFFGDSMTFGLGLEEEETFPARFAVQASRVWGRRVTAGNAAAPILGPRDFAPFLRRVRQGFVPDFVVAVVYLGNDFYDNFSFDRAVIDGYPMAGWAARMAASSWRARLCLRFGVAWKIENWLLRNAPALAMDTSHALPSAEEAALTAGFPPSGHDFTFLDDVEESPPIQRLVARMEECLAALQATAAGLPVVVLVLPTYVHVLPGHYGAELATRNRDGRRFVAGTSQARVAAICARLSLRCLDATPVLKVSGDPQRLFLGQNQHLSAAGCEVLAAALVDWLR